MPLTKGQLRFLRKHIQRKERPRRVLYGKKSKASRPVYFRSPVTNPEPIVPLTYQEISLVGEIKRLRGISWDKAEAVFRAQKQERKNAHI